ncbi:MAG TPA: class I SAM-dependent methyltransferase [Candidatus Peribacterales bacterium]|nr:class I SAM-dependent methyltransferase [Candidatus Peribacterales bacterium]
MFQWKYKTERQVNPFAKELLQHLKNPKELTLLDLGCGDGRDAEFFFHQGFTVTAVDLAEEGIQILHERTPEIHAVTMDIREVDFPSASFDVLYAHLSVQYFDDATTRSIFHNMHRMLRPGGCLFVKCKSTRDPLFGKGEKVGENMYRYGKSNTVMTRHFFTQDFMSELLEEFSEKKVSSSTAVYDGKESAFIDAVARK